MFIIKKKWKNLLGRGNHTQGLWGDKSAPPIYEGLKKASGAEKCRNKEEHCKAWMPDSKAGIRHRHTGP